MTSSKVTDFNESIDHALVIGGSGMLAAVSLHLAKRANKVSVCARRPERLVVPEQLSDTIEFVRADYTNLGVFMSKLRDSTANHGRFDLVVSWIHDTAPEAVFAVASSDFLAAPCRFIHVVGSAYGDPLRKGESEANKYQTIPNIDYSQIILGFIVTGKSARWLTHAEIAAGVIEGIQNQVVEQIVGTVTPWDLRP